MCFAAALPTAQPKPAGAIRVRASPCPRVNYSGPVVGIVIVGIGGGVVAGTFLPYNIWHVFQHIPVHILLIFMQNERTCLLTQNTENIMSYMLYIWALGMLQRSVLLVQRDIRKSI